MKDEQVGIPSPQLAANADPVQRVDGIDKLRGGSRLERRAEIVLRCARKQQGWILPAERHRLYAVAPAEMAREIGLQLGSQFLNPPAAPMFVIDRAGQPQPLPFGVKSAQALVDALKPFLDETK
jgi:hypothetical protein